MSVLSVVTKVVWAVGIFTAIFLKLGAWAFPASMALSEGIKSLALFAIAKRHLGFPMRVDRRATFGVIVASMPFFVSGIAANVTNKIDVTILAERPKLKAFKPKMKETLTALTGAACVNIKAGTNEGCDAIGRGEAIAAHAVVLLAPA